MYLVYLVYLPKKWHKLLLINRVGTDCGAGTGFSPVLKELGVTQNGILLGSGNGIVGGKKSRDEYPCSQQMNIYATTQNNNVAKDVGTGLAPVLKDKGGRKAIPYDTREKGGHKALPYGSSFFAALESCAAAGYGIIDIPALLYPFKGIA